MPDVRWSIEAERTSFGLPSADKRALIRAVQSLRLFPEMGEMVQTGRFRGQRRLLINNRWSVFYRVTGPERTCFISHIRAARRKPV